jgi:hypothetical protein
MDHKQFYKILNKYGMVASWTIWDLKNVKDITVIFKNIRLLRTDVIFAALNISKKVDCPFANFHRSKNDEKLGYALSKSKYSGSYITDVIKGYKESNSFKLKKHVSPLIEKKHIEYFKEELKYIGGNTKLIVAIGNEAYRILKSHLNNNYKIIRITHYSYRFQGCSDPKIYAKKIRKELSDSAT